MELSLLSPVICRSARLGLEDELQLVWKDLQGYIEESSPEFYNLIRDYDYTSIEQLSVKEKFTVWKYYNRAKYRPTPFGSFAAFSLVPLTYHYSEESLTVSKLPRSHYFKNWKAKETLDFSAEFILKNAKSFRTNNTYYINGDMIRFLSSQNDQFELSAVNCSDIIKATLEFCKMKRDAQIVQRFLIDEYQIKPSLAIFFIKELVEQQLLVSDLHPNIIGDDFFKRTSFPLMDFGPSDYLISERQHHSGELHHNDLKIIPEMINHLKKHILPQKNRTLDNFKREFQRKFEGQKIPLMQAIDPDLGIGYRLLTADPSIDSLVNELKALSKSIITSDSITVELSPLHLFVLNGMLGQETIQLENFTAENSNVATKLANTMSILLYCTKERIIISQMGGCTANTLLGRFTMASDEVTTLGKNIARIEENANPEIIFFDIAYQFEHNADNINRRKAIYDFELPILNWSECENIVDPNDIYVSVVDDEIILQSKLYGKRLIPRLASAYNYNRSDLSLYRFLSDIQHQGLCSELNVNIKDVLPGLNHYQRIQYKSIVLSSAKWAVPRAVCTGNSKSRQSALLSWLKKYKLKGRFKCGQTDQTLIFNPEDQHEMEYFLTYCKNKEDLYIEETFLTDNQLVVDELGKPYLSEFVLNLTHGEQIYKPHRFRQETNDTMVKKTFPPTDEWLYFEIYCHPSRSKILLQELDQNYLKPKGTRISSWFFINYNDPEYHIRLRIKTEFKQDIPLFLEQLPIVLHSQLQCGVVKDLQIKTYNREIERYGSQRIDAVEHFFNLNSQLILYIITRSYSNHHLYGISILLIENILETLQYDLHRQLNLTDFMASAFSKEMHVKSEALKRINSGFKDFINEIPQIVITNKLHKKVSENSTQIVRILEVCEHHEKDKMLADLFHMHVNRLFAENQRIHEMIIYHYLTRKIKAKIGRLQQLKKAENISGS